MAHPRVMDCSQIRTVMETELSRVVDALPGMIWTALPDGQVDFLNQRWREYTGFSFEEAFGSGWQAAIYPDDLPGLLERWRSMLASGKASEMEARLRRFDGEYRWFLLCTSPLRDEAGQVARWYGLSNDIEDRKRAEEALTLARTQIVDGIPALVAVMTPGGEVELVNRLVLEYFGKTIEELKGWATTNAVHPDDLPDVVAAWTEAVATGHPYEIESRHRRADGVYRWFHVCGFPLRD